MIRLIEDYVILTDELNYTLAKETGVDKDGKPSRRAVGYYGTLSGALKRLREEMVRSRLKDGEKSLSEAIDTIREANKKVDELLAGLERLEDDGR